FAVRSVPRGAVESVAGLSVHRVVVCRQRVRQGAGAAVAAAALRGAAGSSRRLVRVTSRTPPRNFGVTRILSYTSRQSPPSPIDQSAGPFDRTVPRRVPSGRWRHGGGVRRPRYPARSPRRLGSAAGGSD